MHLWFQSTPKNLNAQINKLQHRLHIIENNRHLDAPGLVFLGTASLGLFRTLVRVLDQFKCVHLRISGVGLVHWHQLVGTVSEIGSFYMNATMNFITM
jgi:hypothetical protein